MTDTTTTNNPAPCYIPLNHTSQCGKEKVLYYNANAPLDDIYECATARLKAVINLCESVYEFDKCDAQALQAMASVAALLLNDSLTLLQEVNPIANRLRANKKG